jgi:membrane dipeptidase
MGARAAARLACPAVLASLGLALLAPPIAASTPPPPFAVVDLHVDQPYRVHYHGRDPSLNDGHVTRATMARGAYVGVVLALYLPDTPPAKAGARSPTARTTIADAESILADIGRIAQASGVLTPLPFTSLPEGNVAAFTSIEGAGPFAEDPSKLDDFLARGVRLVGLVHANDDAFASSATGKGGATFGLTDAGKALAEHVYEQGALIDVSHLSDAGFADIVPIAAKFDAPIVATHSNARALCAHPRNLTDEQLRAIAKSRGVVGLNFYGPFVATDPAQAHLDAVVGHALHLIRVMGIDHVAIGSDFDGMRNTAKGLEDASKLPELANRLQRAGVSTSDVRKLFAYNALRVLAWRSRAYIDKQLRDAQRPPSAWLSEPLRDDALARLERARERSPHAHGCE